MDWKFVLTTAANTNKATFKITDDKLYVPVVTLSAEDNAKLSKLLSERFKRTVYWNEYKVIGNKIIELLLIILRKMHKRIAWF